MKAVMASSQVADLLVMTTLPDERDAVLHRDRGAFLELNWGDEQTSWGRFYHTAVIDQATGFRVAVAMTREQGTERMAALTAHMLHELQPRCAVLIGICAGDGVEAQYCDVVVPDVVEKGFGGKRAEGKADKPDGDQLRAVRFFDLDELEAFGFSWSPQYARAWTRPTLPAENKISLIRGLMEYDKGKPHPSTRRADYEDYEILMDELKNENSITFGQDFWALTDAARRNYLAESQLSTPRLRDFQCVVGKTLVTGPDVEERPSLFKELREKIRRSIVAVEREAYGFLMAVDLCNVPAYFVAKAVQDYGRWPKTDRYRYYAARASARFAIDFVAEHADRLPPRSPHVSPPTDRSDRDKDVRSIIPQWSRAWTISAAGSLSRILQRPDTRSLYLMGAPRSGKSMLLAGLAELVQQQTPSARIITIPIRTLVADFPVHESSDELRNIIFRKIWSGLDKSGYWRQRLMLINITEEMRRILAEEIKAVIYILFEDLDSAIELGNNEIANKIQEAVSPVFEAIKPFTEGGREAVRMVFTAQRPAADIVAAYPGSPFNNAEPIALRRFDLADCNSLASAAGVQSAQDRELIFRWTGGHRSLLWAILGSIADDPSALIVARDRPMSLPRIRETIEVLTVAVTRWPRLRDGLARIAAGGFPGSEAIEVLRDAMLVTEHGSNIESSWLEQHFAQMPLSSEG